MYVLRPICQKDLDAIYALAVEAEAGITTLPKNKSMLEERLGLAVASFFKEPNKPAGEDFWFVLEDLSDNRIVGSSAIFSKVGGFQPSYTYMVKTKKLKSDALKVNREVEYLELYKNHDGPTELGSLFLSAKHRKGGIGRLLAMGRYAFMAQHPECFEDFVIAELRGRISKSGQSHFWDAIGKHFFGMEILEADMMTLKDKSFIAELIPEYPIYIPLLPKAAQEAIGKVHPNTEPALRLLEQEGFRPTGEVDIFEGGPVLGCKFKSIRSIKQSQITPVRVSNDMQGEPLRLVSNVSELDNFRAMLTEAKEADDGLVEISQSAFDTLRLAPNAQVCTTNPHFGKGKK
ncbi:MAG: arginine N-succinyltransferase [Candidatus Omnitrophota bacterium]|jgi:arginine N-succinyltransferase